MAQKEDSLFLLEVLVDKIVFVKTPCFSDKDFRTCVNVECPSVKALEICDDDPGTNVAKSDGPFIKTFNSGKSCLFSLKEDEITKAMSKFPVKVSVNKSLPCGCLPTKILLGEATIDMTKEFVEARNRFLADPNSVSYQALKDSFRLSATDGGEAGEIIMFLRISCFGKLIVTKFQGSGGPNLAGGASGAVDRSCLPQKEFQTTQEPCVCGAKRIVGDPTCTVSGGAGHGVCPPARDPYNSMPCEDPDEACYCSGPKQPAKQKMVCRNTDQYCLHVPKGTFLHSCSPHDEENIGLIKNEFWSEVNEPVLNLFNKNSKSKSQIMTSDCVSSWLLSDLSNDELLKEMTNPLSDPSYLFADYSVSDLDSNIYKQGNFSFQNTLEYFWYYQSTPVKLSTVDMDMVVCNDKKEDNLFGNNETSVYMTLFEDFRRVASAGTQATGSVNKCLQFDSNKINSASYCSRPIYKRSSTNLLYIHDINENLNNARNPEVYFFGRKSDPGKCKKGMGSCESLTKRYKQESTSTPVKTSPKTPPKAPPKSATSAQSKSPQSSVSVQTKNSKVTSSACSTNKSVTIKAAPPKQPCPAVGTVKGEMMATVSHIKISPVQPCPIHGNDPCQGPKCVTATKQEEQGPVKVSTVSNPRRGVFELVIRKMTGAPLARNELMLEWTPPPCRAPPCSGPCPKPPSCRQSKYKLVACRSPCKPKCSNKIYKRASSPMPRPPICPPPSCKRCKGSCCGKSCGSCPPVPCGPSSCISPCAPPPCCANPCKSPCVSSPCLRPCPVGHRRPKRALSHPRIRAHPKRNSPCANRAKFCPAVRCKSPLPCFQCCNFTTCYPPNFCPLAPPKPISSCTSCCSTICE
ncbi:uncharacterized protein [Battus philenor]|uniref:uncharacterized protein n=1 Tax=Battus philenor TaxID=42288 RepID=UPI0035D055A7